MKKITSLIAVFSVFLNFTNAQPGKLDSSFGTNGIVKSDLGSGYSYELVGKQVLVQTDGSIYVILLSVGQTLIAKKFPDGSADSSYGHNGFSGLMPVAPACAAFQSDGKIVVAGISANSSNAVSALIRYNTDGSADNSFSGDGLQSIDIAVASIAVQTDGKIVAAGSLTDNGNSYFALGRYNTDGSADINFSNDGIQTTDFGFSKATGVGGQYPESDLGNAVAIQANGKIVVAGSAFNYAKDTREFALARFNTNGNPDSTFSADGRQTTNFGFDAYGYAIALQPDGKIVMAGYTNPNGLYSLAVARYNTNGTPDTNFDADGKQTTDVGSIDDYTNSVAIQGDGKIVVEGVSWNGSDNDFSVVRYNTNGSLDLTFALNGKLTTDFGSTDDYANSLAVQADGKIITGGYAYSYSNNTNSGFVVAKYNANGSLDNTFNKNGKLTENLHQGYTVYRSTVIQKDGKVITAGYTWNGSNYNFATARYNISGSLDSTFNGNGIVSTEFGANDGFANSAAVQTDGKIVVAGEFWNGSNNDFAVARYNTNGSPDSTFGNGGKLTTDISANDDFASSVIIQKDGKLVVTGYSNTGTETNVDFVAVRYKTNGSVDSTFGINGKQMTDFNLSNDFAYSAAIQTDGKILVGGYTGTGTENNADFALVRYNTNGSLDTSFNANGKQTTDFEFSDNYINSIAIQSDGKIVAGGHNGNYGAYKFALARYNINGSLDNTFNGSGNQTTNFEFKDASINSIAIQTDGKIVAGGSSNNNFALARFNADGSADTTFNHQGVQITLASAGENMIQSIAIKDNKIYAAGFGQYPGNFGVIASYLLTNGPLAPAVSITSPANNTTYTSPATIKITAAAFDADGTIAGVKFYKNSTYLKTVFTKPFTYTLANLPPGTYSITAKAIDNTGLQTVSAPVKVIVSNKAPVVNIISPSSNSVFTSPAVIKVIAAASDSDGTVTSVKFYNNTTYLKTVFKSPYTCTLSNLLPGTYSITAKATDNTGTQTTSAAVSVSITATSAIVSNRFSLKNDKTTLNDALRLTLSPDPAADIVNVHLAGLQQNKQATISVISVSGIVLKTVHINASAQTIPINVSSLISGMYLLKVVCGNTVLHKQFVKL